MHEPKESTYLLKDEVSEVALSAQQLSAQPDKNLSPTQLLVLPQTQHTFEVQSINAGEIWGSRIGFTLTTIAMIIQGILAFLLWEVVWRNFARDSLSSIVYEIVLYFIGIPLLTGSVIGKVALVSPYNDKSFKQLGSSIQQLVQNRNEWIIDRRNYSRQWMAKDILLAIPNGIMTINVATVFGVGVTNLGVNGVANLLIVYKKPLLNQLAKVIVTPCFQLPFIVSTMTCNILGFPNIHMNAVARLKQFFNFFVTNPAYRCLTEDAMRCLLAANLEWKLCAEGRDSRIINKYLSQLFHDDIEEQLDIHVDQLTIQQVDGLLKKEVDLIMLFKIGRPSISKVKYERAFEFVFTRYLTIIILAMVLRGLFNFFTITEKTMQLLHLSFLGKSAGILDFISMSSIGLDAVFLPTVAFLQYLFFARNYEANVIAWPYRAGLAILTTILIGLGGFPNGYQEAQIGGSTLEIGVSIFSAWIELFGTYNLIYNSIEQSKIKKDPYSRLIIGVKNKLEDRINAFLNLEPEKVKELAATYIAPDQAEKIHMLSPQRPCYVKIKEIISCLIWSQNSQRLAMTSVQPDSDVYSLPINRELPYKYGESPI